MQIHRFATFLITSWLLLGCQNLNVGTVSVTRVEYNNHTVTNESRSGDVELFRAEPESSSQYLHLPAAEPLAAVPESKASEPRLTSSAVLCPMFHAPSMPPAPPIPLKELEAVGSSPARVDELQRRHIEELRMYILRVRELWTKSYTRYLADCRTFTNKSR